MLTLKDLITFLALLVTLVVAIVRRQSSKANRNSPSTAPPANLKSELEGVVNKDRRPGGK